jgi:hypothetical protein
MRTVLVIAPSRLGAAAGASEAPRLAHAAAPQPGMLPSRLPSPKAFRVIACDRHLSACEVEVFYLRMAGRSSCGEASPKSSQSTVKRNGGNMSKRMVWFAASRMGQFLHGGSVCVCVCVFYLAACCVGESEPFFRRHPPPTPQPQRASHFHWSLVRFGACSRKQPVFPPAAQRTAPTQTIPFAGRTVGPRSPSRPGNNEKRPPSFDRIAGGLGSLQGQSKIKLQSRTGVRPIAAFAAAAVLKREHRPLPAPQAAR